MNLYYKSKFPLKELLNSLANVLKMLSFFHDHSIELNEVASGGKAETESLECRQYHLLVYTKTCTD